MTGGLNAKVGRLSEDMEKILAGSHFSAAATSGNDCVFAGSRDGNWPRYIKSILRGSKFL